MTNGFTNWDDNYYVTENPFIQSLTLANFATWFSKSFLGLYQPFILASLAIDYSLAGGQAWIFHLTNIVLHLANTILVFFLLKNLFRNPILSIIATLIFALHPIQVESVAWVTERKNLLYALFFLSSIVAYLKYLESKKTNLYRLMLIFFIAALMSKAAAVVLPLIFMLVEFACGENPFQHKLLEKKIPLLFISFIFGLFTLYFHYHHGSLVDSSGLSTFGRLLLVSKGVATYFFNFIAPFRLSTYNPLPETISSTLLIECLLFYIIGIVCVIYLKFRKINAVVLWGLIFFLINIGLFLIPPGVPVIVSDRYMYLAIIGPAVILGFGINFIISKFKRIKYFILTVFGAWLLVIGNQTYQQNQTWKNSLNLWNRVISVHGEQPFALIQRGSAYRTQGLKAEAMKDYSRSIELNPRFYRAFEYRAYMFSLDGQYQKAIDDFEVALEQYPGSDFAKASLGFNYRKLGQFSKAMLYLDEALTLNPKNTDALINRGQVFQALGQTQKACDDFLKAQLFNPKDPELDSLIKETCQQTKE